VWSASVNTFESVAASTATRISAFVWSAVAEDSMPSSLVPSAATSRPSTVPATTMLLVTVTLSTYASLNLTEVVPRSTSLSVTGTIAPS
jgi:hypothetical protein